MQQAKMLPSVVIPTAERPVNTIAINRDGDLLWTAGIDGRIALWKVQTGERVGTYHASKKYADGQVSALEESDFATRDLVNSLDISYDSSQLIACCGTNITIFQALTGRLLNFIQEECIMQFVQWSKNFDGQNKFVICHGTKGGLKEAPQSIKIYHAVSQSILQKPKLNALGEIVPNQTESVSHRDWELRTTIHVGADATCAHWGAFDKTIISAHTDGRIYQWDAETGEELQKISGHTKSCTISLISDRTVFVSCSRDGFVKMWTAGGGYNEPFQCVKRFNARIPLNACAISPLMLMPPSKSLEEDKGATGSSGGETIIGSECKPWVAVGGGQEEEDVTTTRQGEGYFETVIINMAHESLVGTLKTCFSPTRCIAFTPDGRTVVTGHVEGNVRINRLETDGTSIQDSILTTPKDLCC